MNRRDVILSLVVLAVFALLMVHYAGRETAIQSSPAGIDQSFAECGSIQNGTVQNVTDTTRTFINLPKNLYPNVQLEIDQQGASAGYVSNAGQYGYAFGANNDPNCWSYYFEFDGEGTVDIRSKSGVSSVPDYHIQFVVSSSTAQ